MRKFLISAMILHTVLVGCVSVHAGGGCFGWAYTQTGSSGPDAMQGEPGKRDVINGRAGDDAILGRGKADRLCGRGGQDAIDGEGGSPDRINGGQGTDVCAGEFQVKCES